MWTLKTNKATEDLGKPPVALQTEFTAEFKSLKLDQILIQSNVRGFCAGHHTVQ